MPAARSRVRAARRPPRARDQRRTVVVRPASAADVDTVVALRLALLREEATSPLYATPRRQLAAVARTLSTAQLASPTEVTLLAWEGTEAVGLLRCAVSRTTRLVLPLRYGVLTSAYVAPTHRRRGVLRALVREAERWCRTHGLSELRLHCTIENEAGQASWDRLGFAPVEVTRRRVLSPE